MRITVAPDICVVIAKKDNTIEYWAAATVRENAVAAVEKRTAARMDRDANETAPNNASCNKAEDAIK
jgi:hypothetical protein